MPDPGPPQVRWDGETAVGYPASLRLG